MTQICITATAVTGSQLTGWLHLIPADIYLSVRDGVEAMFMRLGPAVSNRSANVIHTSHCFRACNCYLCNCLSEAVRIYHPIATGTVSQLLRRHVCPHDEESVYATGFSEKQKQFPGLFFFQRTKPGVQGHGLAEDVALIELIYGIQLKQDGIEDRVGRLEKPLGVIRKRETCPITYFGIVYTMKSSPPLSESLDRVANSLPDNHCTGGDRPFFIMESHQHRKQPDVGYENALFSFPLTLSHQNYYRQIKNPLQTGNNNKQNYSQLGTVAFWMYPVLAI